MKDENILSRARIGMLLHAPKDRLKGGIRTYARHLQLAFPRLEIFPRPEWPERHWLAQWNFKAWYLNWLKNDLGYSRSLEKLHWQKPFDLLLAISCTGLFLNPRRLGIPIISFSLGCFAEFADQTVRGRWDRFLQKTIAGAMDKKSGKGKYCIAISEKVRGEIKDRYDLDCQVIPLGVDLNCQSAPAKKEVRRQMGVSEAQTIGLFVGPAQWAKGWDIILQTAASLPQTSFVCITDLSLVSDLPKNLILKNSISEEEKNKWYQTADFFLFPSRYEAGVYAVLEAMSFDLPVIVSPWVGSLLFGAKEGWGPAEGVYIARSRDEGYVEAIQACLARERPPQTRSFVERHHSLEQFCQSYRALALRLIRERASRPMP